MLKSKSFVKKTKKGNVVKVVKEHYLRDDITCGISGCKSCTPIAVAGHLPMPISFDITEAHPLQRTVLVPDTNIALHQVCFYATNEENNR